MSIYDDLANSGYMNQEEIRKQFNQSNYGGLEQSMEATNKFVDFNQYEIEHSQAVLDNIQVDPQFKFGGNANNAMNQQRQQLQQQQQQQQQQYANPNYKKVFNPNLLGQQAFDDYQMPSAIKSPSSNLGNQSNLDIQQNLFGKVDHNNLNSNQDDDFLKDSTTGLPYNQPKRVLQLEDDDIIQIHNQQQNIRSAGIESGHQDIIKTGRFASGHNSDNHYNNQHHDPTKKSLYEEDINRFKNQNEYLQQILMQLQNPIQDPFGINSNYSQIPPYPQTNQQQNLPSQIHKQEEHGHHAYQRSMSQNVFSESNLQQTPNNNIMQQKQNYDLIKDNSILEIAKLKQNSGNGSDSVTPQSIYDNQDCFGNKNLDFISRDISYIQNQQYSNIKNPLTLESQFNPQFNLDNQEYFKIPTNNLPTVSNTVGNSIISYDKFTPNYPAMKNAVPGQSYIIDEKVMMIAQQQQRHGVSSDNHLLHYNNNNKENFDYNQPQLQGNQNNYGNQFQQQQDFHQKHQQQYTKQHSYPIIQTDQSLIQDPFPSIKQLPITTQYQQLQQQLPIQINQQIPNISNRQMTEQEFKRKEIMSKFDDIPIKDLKKAEGYQEKVQNENYDEYHEVDDSQLSLIEKIEHPKWKIRMSAYKEINNLFYNEYSKECLRAKGQLQENDNEYDENGNLIDKPFEQYGPMLHKIISDSNLIAQYEGLNCLFAYIKFAPEIKNVVFQVSGILLEKIQHNKPNLKEITLKIILNIFKKDKSNSMLPEMLKRFKNKNFKIATFAVEAVYECMKQNTLNDENSLKQIFKALQDNISHPNKELKEATILLVQEIFKNCDDDINNFMRNLKNLRPVQQKDIKDLLTEVQKHNKNLATLFKGAPPQTYTEGFSPKKNKALTDESQQINEEIEQNQAHQGESDLTLLVPENFNEIPYVSQINVKKKGLEAFNVELEKLIMRKQNGVSIVNKDYSQIFNVVVHMLEDSNALVFMEAIKTLEYLCILLGKNIKPQKMRQFLALLTDKYKETKSGPVAAVNKALQTIIKKQSLPLSSLFDHLINTIAQNSKNARVKQLILEKCDQTIQEEKQLKGDETMLINIFKSVKDKLLGLIQKDTNASVRDAAVSIIATFKAFIINSTIIDEAINSLPKYRINEINKMAQERAQSQQMIKQQSPVNNKESKAKKIDPKHQSPQQQQQQMQQSQDFFYQGKNISGQYQIHLAEIILSLKKLATNSNISITQLQEKWDNSIENLGELGIKESKSVIISCVHWLFSQNCQNISDQVQLIECLLGLVKKIFCIERSVETDTKTGISQELNKAIQLVLLSLKWISYQKQLENILNVIMSSASNTHQFLESLLSSYEFFTQTANDQELVSVIMFTSKWLQSKIEILQTKGISINDLDEFRNRILSRYLDIIDDEISRNNLLKQMIAFKTELDQSLKNQQQYNDTDQDQESQDQKYHGKNNFKQSDLHISELQQPKIKSIGEQFIDIIDQDFQGGLQMLKSFSMNPQILDSINKEVIFKKVLSIVTQQTKNPTQKQQQAFSMKALLWMKEEILGIEDCFQFTTTIMTSYAKAEQENRDSSVELFLLNNWVKQLRLKDLIDRVSIVCQEDPSLFKTVFNWLMMHSLNGNATEQWSIEDFRKISLLLARNMLEEQVTEFFEISVEKFGIQKVQDFMEIQLMHNQQDYNQFMNWFIFKFRPQSTQATQNQNIKLPQIDQQRVQTAQNNKQRNYEDLQLKEALLNNNQLTDESIIHSTRNKNQNVHSKLYQQMREKRKNSNQRKQQEDDGLNKYDQIINRLEAQLQMEKQNKQESNSNQSSNEKINPNKQPNLQQDVDRNFQFYNSKGSNYYQSDKSKRYQIVKTDEDDDLEDSIMQQNDKQQLKTEEILYQSEKNKEIDIDNKQDQLKESTIKENLWKLEKEKLEQEKQRIEKTRYELMRIKNQETAQWKDKYEEIKNEHEEVISNLQEANKCYLTQVSENEELKNQLKQMQDQHKLMMKKFEQFEEKLSQQQEQAILEKYQKQKDTEVTVVKQEQLAIVEKVFQDYQVQVNKGDEEIGTKKIQELLLNFGEREETQKIGTSLFVHYLTLKAKNQKFNLLKGLSLALDSEDILFALPLETYKTVLDFNLKVFANEKALIEKNSIRQSTQSMQRNQNEQNEVTMESQKLVSKLLNSKEFTTSLVTLFQILRQAMPTDLSLDLSEEQKHYLKVIMRCISRITKALHSENPDLIRAFDVLIEMQKIFLKNPPENLREDLPCLQDFDYIYRCLKDVSDKLMELQPHKVITFLEFVSNQPENAFIKYMNQVMAPIINKNQQRSQYQDTYEDYEDEEPRYQSNQHY